MKEEQWNSSSGSSQESHRRFKNQKAVQKLPQIEIPQSIDLSRNFMTDL